MKYLLMTSMLVLSLCASAFAAESSDKNHRDLRFRCFFKDLDSVNKDKNTGNTWCKVRGKADIEFRSKSEGALHSDNFIEIECSDGFHLRSRQDLDANVRGNDIVIATEKSDQKLALLFIEDVLRRDRNHDSFAADLLYSGSDCFAKRISGRCELDLVPGNI